MYKTVPWSACDGSGLLNLDERRVGLHVLDLLRLARPLTVLGGGSAGWESSDGGGGKSWATGSGLCRGTVDSGCLGGSDLEGADMEGADMEGSGSTSC